MVCKFLQVLLRVDPSYPTDMSEEGWTAVPTGTQSASFCTNSEASDTAMCNGLSVIWDGQCSDGQNAASGVYILRLESGPGYHSRGITLMKW